MILLRLPRPISHVTYRKYTTKRTKSLQVMACSIHFHCYIFFSFFTVLEHGPTRRFTWVCFSATRPLRPIYHRKRYTLSIVKCHREAHFPGRKNSGKNVFSIFFHEPQIAARSSRYLKRTPLGSPFIPPYAFSNPPRHLAAVIFFPRDPVWYL